MLAVVRRASSGAGSIEEAAAGGLAFWPTGFRRQLRVLVMGAEDVGKSLIIRRLIGQDRLIADTDTAAAAELSVAETASSASFSGM